MSHPQAPSLDLRGKTALVTGASKGIGKACALSLASCHAHVITVARSKGDLDTLVAESGGRIEPWAMDVTNPEFLRRIRDLKCLDILVNNVGTNKPMPITEVSEDTLDLMLNLNVRAAFLSAQAAAEVMQRAGAGSIINITSQMGHIGAANRTVYCMTKHAIEGLTKAMAVELAPHGIRVNSVAPTFISTPLTAPMFENPEFYAEVISKIPLARVGNTEEVANAVTYLASDLSSLTTGDSIKVDGGWTAQ
ncbi:NAD(P)-dependent oxidoreductase [Microbulbifer flavimaris]|uniref:NAD(P)-dependent oxidoreductase n=1 Tax=Microbulbifer flavimaris TaxID=1781068 RepID=A0ABX4I2B8_9GAMM|nr:MULTISPECIES: SDR family oxidoreductase [Microbulbifer]KUJ84481.1 3-oxoacyl-ACP reductase [Microbulbifer sp. ZGT114]PCO06569.1 NAD(P)-dependent oxidoreductase [Microbulbifer flavimaris]